MKKQVAATSGKPGEDILLSFASDTEAFYGRLNAARESVPASGRLGAAQSFQ